MRKILLITTTFTILMSNQTEEIKPKAYWIDLLKSKKFEKLDKKLSSLQNLYIKNPKNEYKINLAIESFQNSDPDIEDEIKEWIEHNPDSIYAHLALGEYFYHIGVLSRGNKFISKTTREQISNMEKNFKIANEDYDWVLLHNKKTPLAYAKKIKMSHFRDNINNLYKEGLKNNRFSLSIRKAYYAMNLTKWSSPQDAKSGHNYKNIEKIIKETKPLIPKNPKLKAVLGFLNTAKADEYYIKNNINKALEEANKAVEIADIGHLLRSDIYWYKKEFKKALNDVDIVLKIKPDHSAALSSKGDINELLGNKDVALNAYNLIIKNDKYNPNALLRRGILEYSNGNKDKAIVDILNSLKYGKRDKNANYMLGFYYYWDKKDYSKSIYYAKNAIDYGKNSSGIYYIYTASLWQKHDCKFVKAAYAYKKVCQNSSKKCDNKKLNWAIKSADFAVKRGICK